MKIGSFTSLNPLNDRAQIQTFLAGTLAALETTGARGAPEGTGGWYRITDVTATDYEIRLFNYIGVGGVAADDFIHELDRLRATRITLRINSPGGDVDDAVAIFNALQRHQAKIDVVVEGQAASAASFLAMVGDTVAMAPHSKMMIHDAQVFLVGALNPTQLRSLASVLDIYSDDISTFYAARAGGDAKEWRARMSAETWYTAEGAVAAGLADSVLEASSRKKAAQSDEQAPSLAEEIANAPIIDVTGEDDEPDPEPQPKPIDWKAVFQEAVEMAEDDLFAPVQEAV